MEHFRPYGFFGLAPKMEPKNKEEIAQAHLSYMLDRTQSMFKWTGLPDSVPQRILELYLQVNGSAVVHEVDGELRVFVAGLGGEPDIYYQPTLAVISNPRLKTSINGKLGEDTALIRADSLMLGLRPMFTRYAQALAENELSIYLADINSRIISLISAADDTARDSALLFLKRIVDGDLGVISDPSFIERVQTLPYATSSSAGILKELIEHEQYLRGSWYNDIGLNALFNMKREAIGAEESALNDDALLPLVHDMLEQRKQGCAEVNRIFGTNWDVELNSSWENVEREQDAATDALEQEAEPENPTEDLEQIESPEGGTDDEQPPQTD